MRIVLQRVQWARVSVESRVVGAIGNGLLILLGVGQNDGESEAEFLAKKCSQLRVFSDTEGKMNQSLMDVDGEALVVSQFTLYGDCRNGRRPSYTNAAVPEKAEALYEYFVRCLRPMVKNVETGVFGAHMHVELLNDGPVTLILER